ncbi:hypothetical protein CANINC_004482 [Pichia inconspicua]|uniref:V-type proton ATPase subunit C n=1 Tax=Pichia inconspicua TaxID=52247 RepID=A0A4T0WVD5_9ASCO|nr:hypothetical protein CANINC_004482 [[Candida] inconspicua]
MPHSYLLVSLPASVGAIDETQSWIETNVAAGSVEVTNLKFPDFKIGTLDSLVQQSEELSKLDSQLHSSVSKVIDIYASLTNTPLNSVSSKLKIENTNIDNYLQHFQWNKSRFRIDRSIDDLIKSISNEGLQLDADLRAQFQNYNNIKSNLLSIQRKQNGDLSVKSLHDIVKRDDFVLDSDHLKTVLIAVPVSSINEFLSSYETLAPFVVPRSANLIAQDAEYALYGVTLFKKYEQEFLVNAREHKWTPRDFTFDDSLIAKLRSEFALVQKDEINLRNDIIRLAREAYAEITGCWIHILFLRAFVESVLRYGLPPLFHCFIVKPIDVKNLTKAKSDILARYSYLGGNAFSKDSKGKPIRDSSLHEYAALVDTDYEPFVIYNVEIL